MFICYDDNVQRRKSSYSAVAYCDLDATKYYCDHLSNLFYLEFFAKNEIDFTTKQRCEHEIGIAKKKMSHWKRHPNYDAKIVETVTASLKKQWSK